MTTSPDARLFAARTHSAPLRIGPADAAQGSRLGGRAPALFQASPLRCPRCQRDVVYFCTLESAELHAALGTGTSLSVFYCRDFECLLKARKLQDDAPLAALAHPAAPRASTPTPFDSPLEGRAVLSGAIRDDINAYGEPEQGSKTGGQPGWVQGPEFSEPYARSHNLGFVFQFDEESYPRGMKVGTLPFGGGVLYVFAELAGEGVFKPGGRLVATWQST